MWALCNTKEIIKGDIMSKFEANQKVMKPRWYLMIIVWIIALYYKIIARTKFRKTNFKSYKEPSIILCNHASMIDMANVVSSMFPYRVCWVASIEEFNGRNWLFRRLGVFPKRKFTTDLIVIKRIAELIRQRNMSVCIYPEARFSLAGINEDISKALGKLAKLCKCRVIVIKQKGNFVMSPQWNKHPYRGNKVYVEATQVFSSKECEEKTADQLQNLIEQAFIYDDYKWANENKIRIKCKKRAENIHKILYKCPNCNIEGKTNSKGIHIWCENCNSKWEMDEYSELHCLTGYNRFKLASEWYRWERQECINEVNEGKYHFEDDVRIEKLINPKVKFKPVGTVHMIHDINGYQFKGTLDDGSPFDLVKTPLSTRSIHIEYNYKGKGDAIDIATLEDTWWVYPQNNCLLTKFNFATEAIYDKVSKENQH